MQNLDLEAELNMLLGAVAAKLAAPRRTQSDETISSSTEVARREGT